MHENSSGAKKQKHVFQNNPRTLQHEMFEIFKYIGIIMTVHAIKNADNTDYFNITTNSETSAIV